MVIGRRNNTDDRSICDVLIKNEIDSIGSSVEITLDIEQCLISLNDRIK